MPFGIAQIARRRFHLSHFKRASRMHRIGHAHQVVLVRHHENTAINLMGSVQTQWTLDLTKVPTSPRRQTADPVPKTIAVVSFMLGIQNRFQITHAVYRILRYRRQIGTVNRVQAVMFDRAHRL